MIRYFIFAAVIVSSVNILNAQMSMPGVENSVGYISSGTSIEPKSTAESAAMVHRTLGDWSLMFHANVVLASIQQSGPRGHDKVVSANWFMPMLTRQSGRQSLTLKTMLSLEPLTITKRRYPELFQTGETAFGLPIVDGQHPHDLVMELAARYNFQFTDRFQFFTYGGVVGEPALGPPPFPHRSSASENLLAVLGHHQQDSTHISNNVLTVGFAGGPIQLEASTFHGMEPDENRWNFDGGKPDSFSSRLTIAPTRNLAGQFSVGRINNREALEPDLDTLRTTASIHHNQQFSNGHISSSLIWGRNKDLDHHGHRIFNAFTLESTANFGNRNWAWTRIENADRDATVLVGEVPEVLDVEEVPAGRVQSFTFGYERDIPTSASFLRIGLGFQLTTYHLPTTFKAIYGGRPVSAAILLRIRPAGNMAAHMRMMHRP